MDPAHYKALCFLVSILPHHCKDQILVASISILAIARLQRLIVQRHAVPSQQVKFRVFFEPPIYPRYLIPGFCPGHGVGQGPCRVDPLLLEGGRERVGGGLGDHFFSAAVLFPAQQNNALCVNQIRLWTVPKLCPSRSNLSKLIQTKPKMTFENRTESMVLKFMLFFAKIRFRLKILRSQGHAGSSPASGTIKNQRLKRILLESFFIAACSPLNCILSQGHFIE